MSKPSDQLYQRILVPVDGSPTSQAGLAQAIRIAGLTGGQIRLLHVVDEMPYALSADGFSGMSAELLAQLKQAGQLVLQADRAQVLKAGIAVDEALHESLSGRLCDFVEEQVGSWGADLIVLGTHGRRGLGRALLGSDAEAVLRRATVPVLLVRAPAG